MRYTREFRFISFSTYPYRLTIFFIFIHSFHAFLYVHIDYREPPFPGLLRIDRLRFNMTDQKLFLITVLLILFELYGFVSPAYVPAIFTFGDSIVDAGSNRFIKNCTAQANFPPYGANYFHHPTGRFTNGRTVVDIICESFLSLNF